MNVVERRMGVFALAALAVTACAGTWPQSSAERAAELPPDRGLILFRGDGVGDHPARRIQYSDNEQRVEYALYRGGGAQAEFVYMERPYDLNVVFEFEFTVADKVATWNYSKGQPIQWSPVIRIRTKAGEVFYRPYRLTARNQDCFGVAGEWEHDSRDREYRAGRGMFGYYCAPPGKALVDRDYSSLVNGIGLRGVTSPAADHGDLARSFHRDVAENFTGPEGSRRAIGEAQGAGTATGIAEFPFRYARYFPLAHGSGGQ